MLKLYHEYATIGSVIIQAPTVWVRLVWPHLEVLVGDRGRVPMFMEPASSSRLSTLSILQTGAARNQSLFESRRRRSVKRTTQVLPSASPKFNRSGLVRGGCHGIVRAIGCKAHIVCRGHMDTLTKTPPQSPTSSVL